MKTREYPEISVIRLSPIVQTPMRNLDLIEGMDGTYYLRETHWRHMSKDGSEVRTVTMQPHELFSLGEIIKRMGGDLASRMKIVTNGQRSHTVARKKAGGE
jgi:hypothetical protein